MKITIGDELGLERYFLNCGTLETLDVFHIKSIDFMRFLLISFHVVFDFIMAKPAREELHALITLDCTSCFVVLTSHIICRYVLFILS